ncbi:MAG: hypothetical protein GY792_22725, partial [Gammaproteobacteria bacterium]|nr:hypothetical protein [Gammaproteobacteria bacterium]
GRSSGSASLAQATPVVAKAGALPGDDGVWFDECQVLAPAGPDSGQVGPEDPVSRVDAGPPTSPLVDRDLMAQGEHFELERCPRAEGGEEPADEEEQEGAHGGLARGTSGR